VNSSTARSQNRPDPTHKTVHLTLHVDPIVKRELQRLAQQEGLTVSKIGAAFLKQALQNNVDMHYSALLEPIITSAIRKGLRANTNRLAFLLARNAFTSEQTRNLVTNILGRQRGMTEDLLKTILDMTKRTAQGSLTRRSPELEELIKALKEWLEEQEESN
jgi:small-conductance mechanosensitive channel